MIDFPTASVSPCRMSRKVVIGFFPIALELDRPLFRRVLSQHPLASRVRHRKPLLFVYVSQISEYLVRRRRDQHLAADREDAVEPSPPVADYGRGAGAGFKKAHAWRIPRRSHG